MPESQITRLYMLFLLTTVCFVLMYRPVLTLAERMLDISSFSVVVIITAVAAVSAAVAFAAAEFLHSKRKEPFST